MPMGLTRKVVCQNNEKGNLQKIEPRDMIAGVPSSLSTSLGGRAAFTAAARRGGIGVCY